MFSDRRVFRRTDPDFPTTKAVQDRLVAAGRVAGEGPRAGSAPTSAPASVPTSAPAPSGGFTEAEKSLIRNIHGHMSAQRLLDILNDRLRGDRGAAASPHTIERLRAEMAALPGSAPERQHGWANLRKLLARAERSGTLDRIDERVIADFAVVFSLSTKQLMHLKDTLSQPKEE